MHEQIYNNKIWYQNKSKALHTEHINTTLDTLYGKHQNKVYMV